MSDQTMDTGGMRAELIARTAHRGAIAEIAEIQRRMALREIIVRQQGAKALPLREFYLHTLRGTATFSNAAETVSDEQEADAKRLAILYPMVEALEDLFAKQKEADDQAWAEALADYLRRNYGKGRRPRQDR